MAAFKEDQTHRMTHVPPHLLKHPQGQWRGCEGGARASAPRLQKGNHGCLRALTDAGQGSGLHAKLWWWFGKISAYRACTANTRRLRR